MRRRKRGGSRGKGRVKRKKKRPGSRRACPGEICRAAGALETGRRTLRVGSHARLQAERLLRSSAFLLRPSAAWMRPARTKESVLLYSELLVQMVTSCQNISRQHPKRV